MNKNKINLDNTFDVELSDNIIDLMHFVPKLTEKQANETLNLFPELEYGIPIANYFFSHKEVMKAYSSYSNYLSSVHSAMNPSESIFDEEVSDRSIGLHNTILSMTSYRDSPWRNSHQDQHFASQETPEVDEGLERVYLTRRFSTGL